MHVFLDCFLHVCLALFLISFLEFLDFLLALVSRFFRESVSCFSSFFFKSVLKSEVRRESAIAKFADRIAAVQKTNLVAMLGPTLKTELSEISKMLTKFAKDGNPCRVPCVSEYSSFVQQVLKRCESFYTKQVPIETESGESKLQCVRGKMALTSQFELVKSMSANKKSRRHVETYERAAPIRMDLWIL